MDFSFTEEQELLLESLREWLVRNIELDCRGNEIGGGTAEIMVHIAGRQIPKRYAR